MFFFSFFNLLPQTLLQSGSSSYKKLAEECVKYGVAVELFLTPPTYCDVATLGGLCSTTGGQLHLFPNYQVWYRREREREKSVRILPMEW